MAGTLQADFLQPSSNTGLYILSPTGSTMASVNTSGIYSATGGQMFNASGIISSGSDITVNGLTVGKGTGSISTNTVVGANALQLNTTGFENVSIGYQSSYNNTTGFDNTAIGYTALYSNQTGRSSCAYGVRALYTSTVSDNAAFGVEALYSNTTGLYNFASGPRDAAGNAPLFSNTTGSYNIGVGAGALKSNTTASNNTAVGYQAGYSNTTSGFNTFLGYQAGNTFNYTGGNAYNCFIGSRAGTAVTTGQLNCFVGDASGLVATTGNGNTFIGQSSGNSITTGGKNTIIGAYGGNSGGLDIRTASNYIVLSDGDGNPRGIFTNNGYLCIGGATSTVYNESLRINTANQQGIHINDTSSSSSINYQYFTKGAGPTNVGAIYYNGSTMAYQTTSDYRLKENVTPISNALATVALLKPSAYRWKESQAEDTGFIAHELQQVFPQAVSGEKDAVDANGNPVYQGIDVSFLVATLTASIQELKAIVDTQSAQIAAQAVEIAALKAK